MKKLLCLAAVLGLFAAPVAPAQEPPKGDPKVILAKLLKELDSSDSQARVQAMMGLADFGPAAAPAVPKLVTALKADDEDLRLNAAITLGKIGKDAVPPLIEMLGSNDDDTRFYAIWALGWIGPEAKSAAAEVIKALSDKNEGVRRKAAYTLGRIAADPETAIAELTKALQDKSEDVRQAAADGLSKYGDKAVPSLVAELKKDNADARRLAAHALGEIGSDAKEAVPVLRDLLLGKEAPAEQSQWAARTLAKIGRASVDVLTEGIKDARAHVRQTCLQGLYEMKGDGAPALVDALGDKQVDVRRQAAQYLQNLMISDKSVVIALGYALKDEDDQVRMTSAIALQSLGASAKLAAPHLNKALADPNNQVRFHAFHALRNMGEDPRQGLLQALDSKDVNIRIHTAALMVQVSQDVETATPVLLDALKEKDPALRLQAAYALAEGARRGALKDGQRELDKAVPILVEGLKHDKSNIRQQALQGLQILGPRGAVAAPAILELFQDPEPNIRQQAIYALQNVRGDPKVVLPALGKLMKDDNTQVRQAVIQVFRQYGADAIPYLIDAMNDKEDYIRQQAMWNLQNVQGDLKPALPTLTKLLKSDNGNVRQAVVQLMGRLGEDGLPHVIDGLKDKHDGVRWTAAMMLRNAGQAGRKAAPILLELVQKDTSATVRTHAVYTLVHFGGDSIKDVIEIAKTVKGSEVRLSLVQGLQNVRAKEAMPFLIEVLKDDSAQVRMTAANALGNLRAEAKPALPHLKMLLAKDKDANVRLHCVYALCAVGVEGQDLVVEHLKTADSNMRTNALQQLNAYQYRNKTAVPVFIDCLKDTNPQVRWMSAHLLAQIGPEARDAVPALKEALNDANPTVRQYAQNALQSIQRK